MGVHVDHAIALPHAATLLCMRIRLSDKLSKLVYQDGHEHNPGRGRCAPRRQSLRSQSRETGLVPRCALLPAATPRLSRGLVSLLRQSVATKKAVDLGDSFVVAVVAKRVRFTDARRAGIKHLVLVV